MREELGGDGDQMDWVFLQVWLHFPLDLVFMNGRIN